MAFFTMTFLVNYLKKGIFDKIFQKSLYRYCQKLVKTKFDNAVGLIQHDDRPQLTRNHILIAIGASFPSSTNQ